jgi:hypothetical protein
MIFEWSPANRNYGNLGDALTRILADSVPFASKKQLMTDDKNLYFLIGSVICDWIIIEALNQGLRPVFLNCGWRGESLSQDLVDQSLFFGARGPLTQQTLMELGVTVDVTGDSAYSLKGPSFKSRIFGRSTGIQVFPHILSSDGLSSPTLILDDNDLREKIRKIANAEFVLAGAMHSGILAHHFGVPFAPYMTKDQYIDLPIKWLDWLMQVGLTEEDLHFSTTVDEGMAWFDSVKHKLRKPTKSKFPTSEKLGIFLE